MRAATDVHSVDIFAGCLDQVDLLEMKFPPILTNGNIVLADSLMTADFKRSFHKISSKDKYGHLHTSLNAAFDVHGAEELNVSGIIISIDKKRGCMGETGIDQLM